MTPIKPTTATWNREDRDLLVELRTTMYAMQTDIVAARVEIKEINTGITSRLLNLEGNAITKLEVGHEVELLEGQIDILKKDVNDLKESRIAYRASIKAWLVVGGAAWSITITILSILVAKFFS